MIIKNEIPLLEYDGSSLEVITPDHDCKDLKLPEKCLFAFLGDVVHKYAKENNADIAEELITVSHNIKIYVLHRRVRIYALCSLLLDLLQLHRSLIRLLTVVVIKS